MYGCYEEKLRINHFWSERFNNTLFCNDLSPSVLPCNPPKNLPTKPHLPQAINNDMFLNDGFSVFNFAQNSPGTQLGDSELLLQGSSLLRVASRFHSVTLELTKTFRFYFSEILAAVPFLTLGIKCSLTYS